jgi:RimJ/RimL family protein N-acetyltransferase
MFMTQPMPAAQYPRLLPLFAADYPNGTVLLSLLDGRCPGAVVVDNVENPTAAVAVADFENFAYVGGAPSAEWLAGAFAELCKERYLLLIAAEWLPTAALPDAARVLPRLEFLNPDAQRRPTPVELPEGFSFRPLDADLLERCLWRDQMVNAYGTPEGFIAENLGVCLMRGDEICCEAYAVCPAGGHYEIGVVTHDDYQRRGFAYVTCVLLADECARRGFATSWSCDLDNPASAATARKLGYTTERPYALRYYPRHP